MARQKEAKNHPRVQDAEQARSTAAPTSPTAHRKPSSRSPAAFRVAAHRFRCSGPVKTISTCRRRHREQASRSRQSGTRCRGSGRKWRLDPLCPGPALAPDNFSPECEVDHFPDWKPVAFEGPSENTMINMSDFVQTIAACCTETSSGARNVEKILSRTLLPELSARVLARLAEGRTISSVRVGMNPAGSFCYWIG
jgi:hypothetical protein